MASQLSGSGMVTEGCLCVAVVHACVLGSVVLLTEGVTLLLHVPSRYRTSWLPHAGYGHWGHTPCAHIPDCSARITDSSAARLVFICGLVTRPL